MPQFLSVARRKIEELGAEAFTPELNAAEANRVRELYASGKLRQIWKRSHAEGGVILWEAESEAEVRELFDSLPMARRDMLELLMLTGLVPYPGMSSR